MASTVYKSKDKYMPNYDYSSLKSMSKKEQDIIFAEVCKCVDNDDDEGAYQWMKKLPLAPNLALHLRDSLGKEDFLAEGFNLTDAETVYGKDWVDNYMVDNDE